MIIGLASKSPRREALLRKMGLGVHLISFQYEEELNRPGRIRTEDLAIATARGKMAAAVASLTPPPGTGENFGAPPPFQVVLSADTMVWNGAEIFGKPVDFEDGRRILRALSGQTHQVTTAYCLHHLGQNRELTARAVTTRVSFRPLGDGEIDGYLATGEPMDKAGAYAIQGKGGVFIKSIQGSPSNVIGLPTCELAQDLRLAGLIDENPWG